MAYNLSASPSSPSLARETHLFCNSLSLPNLSQLRIHKNLIFPFKPHSKKPSLRISSKIYVQEAEIQAQTQEPQGPDRKSAPRPKSNAWINPKSPRASKLLQTTHNYRYDSLAKLARSLDSCGQTGEDVSGRLSVLGNKVTEHDAVVVVNHMSNTKASLMALEYFLRKVESPRKVVLYNVTMKVFRKSKDLDGVQKLFDEMLERGIKPDNTTFSTLIGCSRLCSLPEKAVEWYEKMPAFGLEPDGVTCSVMIDSYGKVGKADVAFALYDRARNEKWRLDAVSFSTLIRIYISRGNFDGCLNLYEEMKALGVKPNASVYNSLLEAMGRAKRPWQAKNIYREMMRNEVNPNWATYAALLRAYGRGRYIHDILAVYKEMKEKNFELNVVLYNTILSACADVGFTDEALAVFNDMMNSGTCNPDSWTYSSLITIYSCSGQVEKAETTLNEMMNSGFEPNIIVLTSIIQCYGKAKRTRDVVKTFDMLSDFGITPDEQFLCCLLSVLTEVPKEELGRLTVCIEKANPKLGHFVNLVIDGESLIGEEEASELFDSVSVAMRKAYLNCLIDLSVHVGGLERATQMMKFGLERGIYEDITIRSDKMWYLQLRRLSQGAALTGLRVWMNELWRAVDNGEELPNLLGIDTGHGKHKFSDRALIGLFEAHLKELDAPFHEVQDRPGWFQTTSVAAKAWLESRRGLDDDPNGA